jgi:hypothetical protein
MQLHFKAMWCNGRPKIMAIVVEGRRSFGRIFHRTASAVRGIISRTCDCTVTPPGKLAPLHLTLTRIIIFDVVRLFCSTSELKSSSWKSKRSPPYFLSCRLEHSICPFFTVPFPEMSLIFFPEMTSRAYRFFLFAFLLCGLSFLDMA